MNDTKTNRLKYIHENLINNKTKKHPSMAELKKLSDATLDKIIQDNKQAYDAWLNTQLYIVVGTQNGKEYTWDNWRAADEKDLKACAKNEKITIKEFVLAKGHHICKYCNGIADSSNKDLLCDDCRTTFGHYLYSEL